MNKTLIVLAVAAVVAATTAQAQETKVAIAISGWTGFAPLTLAKEAGLFKKHGLDVKVMHSKLSPETLDRLFRG